MFIYATVINIKDDYEIDLLAFGILFVNVDHFHRWYRQTLLYPLASEPHVGPMHCCPQKKFGLIR